MIVFIRCILLSPKSATTLRQATVEVYAMPPQGWWRRAQAPAMRDCEPGMRARHGSGQNGDHAPRRYGVVRENPQSLSLVHSFEDNRTRSLNACFSKRSPRPLHYCGRLAQAREPSCLVRGLTEIGRNAACEFFSGCPCRIFKRERTDGEARPRLARRARVLPSGRRAESARLSSAIGACDSCCNILGKS
jgi:hypothetical protein